MGLLLVELGFYCAYSTHDWLLYSKFEILFKFSYPLRLKKLLLQQLLSCSNCLLSQILARKVVDHITAKIPNIPETASTIIVAMLVQNNAIHNEIKIA